MADIHGTTDPSFDVLGDLLSGSLDAGTDLGGSISITVEGETVVDIWGGHADQEKTKPWEADTITNVWSTTKTMTSLAALLLVERGELDVYQPVATYWPEFAQNGKESIEVRHLMSHTSGVSAWDKPVVTEDIFDPEKSAAMLAAQAPWWKPGSASGYHALNQGHLVGEVVKRISGRSLGTFFAEEIAGPLNADFHIGLPAEHDHRVSPVVPPAALSVDLSEADRDGPMVRTLTGPPLDASASWSEGWGRAEIGAANGHGNARSVARVQAIVANGGQVDDVKLLSPETIEVIFDEQARGVDLVLGDEQRFGIGYGLADTEFRPYMPDGRICFWGGWGGSIIIVDCDRRMTIAYMMNMMLPQEQSDPRGQAIIQAVYASIGQSTY